MKYEFAKLLEGLYTEKGLQNIMILVLSKNPLIVSQPNHMHLKRKPYRNSHQNVNSELLDFRVTVASIGAPGGTIPVYQNPWGGNILENKFYL